MKRLAQGLGTAALVFVLALLVAEPVARLLWHKEAELAAVELKPDPRRDPERCYSYQPNAKMSFEFSEPGGKILFRTEAQIDEFGRRADGRGEAKRSALFFGGSDVFGWGVDDPATLLSQLRKLDPSRSYVNYGYPGAGAGQMLAMLRSERLSKENPGLVDLVVYVMSPNHFRRAIASARLLSVWYDSCRDFRFGADGTVEQEGTFAELHPWRTAIARGLHSTKLGERLLRKVDFPLALRHGDIQQLFRLVNASRLSVQKIFPGAKFLVVLLERQDPEVSQYPGLLKMFDSAGIRFLDLSGERFSTLPADSHLDAAAYARLAQLIFAQISR